MTHRIAIAQINMHWSTPENVASIRKAMDLAHSRGAQLCGFSELAVTGFHRLIGREARPEVVSPAVQELQTHAAKLSLGIAAGAPTFGADGTIYNSHLLINERGMTSAVIPKRGLTEPEATFFKRGASRPREPARPTLLRGHLSRGRRHRSGLPRVVTRNSRSHFCPGGTAPRS
jgi:predicted amidohydrolase